jgi:hypothetical protein
MTFIPSVQSKIDSNNSTTKTNETTYNGSSSSTIGYNQISIFITSTKNSAAGGLIIEFSNDNSNWVTYFKDTYFTNTSFLKTYNILNTYYKITYNSTESSTFTITTRLNSSSSAQTFYSAESSYQNINNSLQDAFGKLRVSNPFTILDVTIPSSSTGTYDFLSNNMIINTKFSGGATGTFGQSKCIISCNNGVTGTFINQSRKYCNYQPGKSLLFLGSGIIGATGTSTNYSSRIGYFDNNNGLFFEKNQNGMYVVLRNNGLDKPNYTISQNNWNIDSLDGTGSSGFNLNFEKNQLFVIDFEWLSVGRIRFGFYIFGKIYYCHQFINLNTLDGPYMLTPNLPVRYELNNNDVGGSAYLTQICSSVISEGGFNPIGRPFNIANLTPISLSNTNETAILALRANINGSTGTTNQYNHQNIVPSVITVFSPDNTAFFYRLRLYLSPNTISAITWNNVGKNSVSQYAFGGSNISNINGDNIIVDSGTILGKNQAVIQPLENIFSKLIQITSNIDNDKSDVLLITAEIASGNANIYASINWNEAD